MAQRKRTAGDELRDFKSGKISGNQYHNGIDRSDNYIQTSKPYTLINDKGKSEVVSYNDWLEHQAEIQEKSIDNNKQATTSTNNKTATTDTAVKNSNNTSSTGSDIKSFFNGNLNKANSSAEDFKEAIKNPDKSLNDKVKGLEYLYNAAVATGDSKTAEKMQKEYDELADRVNKQTEINRQNVETAEAENAKLAEQAEKEQKYADKYKNSTLEQRKNARIHATTEELADIRELVKTKLMELEENAPKIYNEAKKQKKRNKKH